MKATELIGKTAIRTAKGEMNNMTGELNLTKCGNDIRINSGLGETDIKIGNGIWLILNKEQIKALRDKLNKEAE